MINKIHHSAQITRRTNSDVFSLPDIKDKCSYVNRFLKLKSITNTKRSLSCKNTKHNLINNNNNNNNNTHCYSFITQTKTKVKRVPLSKLKEFQLKPPTKHHQQSSTIPGYKRKDLSGYFHYSNINTNNNNLLFKIEHKHDICINNYITEESNNNLTESTTKSRKHSITTSNIHETIRQDLLSNFSLQ